MSVLVNVFPVSGFAIKPFAQMPWPNIEKALALHYAGDINLSDYWDVGDTHELSINTFTYSNVTYYEVSSGGYQQKATLKILDFDHDDITGTNQKAAITLGMEWALGYIPLNSTSWENSELRNVYVNTILPAIDPDVAKLIKTVNKYTVTSRTSPTAKTISEKLWIPTQQEVFNTGPESGGKQYPYYATVSNRCKNAAYQGWETQPGLTSWILITPGEYYQWQQRITIVTDSGACNTQAAQWDTGFAPIHFCI